MNCPSCGSNKTYRKHSNVEYLWAYHCLKCRKMWAKSKYDAPGIAYACWIKRENVKGHYRVVVRDQFGKIITSMKWSPKNNRKRERKEE